MASNNLLPSNASPSIKIDRPQSSSQSLRSSASSNTWYARAQKAGKVHRSKSRSSYSRSRSQAPGFSNLEERWETPPVESPLLTPQLLDENLVLKDGPISTHGSKQPITDVHDTSPNFRDVLQQQNRSMNHQDDASVAGSDFSESTNVPRRNLRVHDVAALILNKMVGTGIFTTPGLVLSLTKDKPTSIVLWVVGGIHAMLWYSKSIHFLLGFC